MVDGDHLHEKDTLMKHQRPLAIGAALLFGATALAACSGGSASESAPSDAVELTFWGTYGNGGNSAQSDKLVKELIPAFEKANPGITVTYVDMPYDGLKQKLTTGAAAGELPDLIRTDIGWNAGFAKLGAFAQLDGNMPGFEKLVEATYPGTLAATAYDGHYYGLPLDTNTRVLVSNPEALAAAGVTTPPSTFDEVKDLADKLEGKGISVFADGGLEQWNILPWIWSAGGDISDPDQKVSSGYLDSDASVEGVQLLVDLYKKGAIPNLITGNEGATGTSDGLPSGTYATILDGPWMKDIWVEQYPDFAPLYSPMPAGSGGSISVVGGESIVLSSTSKNVEAAYKFLEFTQSEEFQLGMAEVGQMSVVEAYAGKQAEANPFYEPFSAQLVTAKARLSIPEGDQVNQILKTELAPAFEGSTTVKDALTAAAKQIDELLAKK